MVVGERSVVDQIETAGIIGVVRLPKREGAIDAVRALAAGDLSCIEVTATTPGAASIIGECVTALGESTLIGAGSVVDVASAHACVEAGARFLVSPVFQPEVMAAARSLGVPMIPGTTTPTEMVRAWHAGAKIVKLFPAARFGPRYLKDLRGPLPFLKLLPTGGVSLENVGDYIAAGATAVAVGGELLTAAAVDGGDWDGITARASAYAEAVAQARVEAASGGGRR